MQYIIEKTNNPDGSKVTGDYRFYGDHDLDRREFAWAYPREKAMEHKKGLQQDGSKWKLTQNKQQP